MANKNKNQQEEEVLVDVGSSLSKAEQYINNHSKTISYLVVALVVVAGGIWAYMNMYLAPREKAAQEEMVRAVLAFEKDSLQSSINGAANWPGFAEVAESYSGTKAGNVAHFYAGVSFLNLKQFENAIRELDEFKPNEEILRTLKFGAIGDAFHEIGQPKDALDYYERAVSGSKNEFLVPFYLKKAGMTAEILEDYNKALTIYKRLQKDFPDSKEGSDVKKYIARVEARL
jgi:tetratricopeptide (TPR) repeat protein